VIGDNQVSVSFKQEKNSIDFTINQNANDWKILFQQPVGKFKSWKLNGKTIKPIVVGNMEQIEISAKRAKILVSN
jgi:hypothetical protein